MASDTRLLKGCEVELYTGLSSGEIVGLSDRISKRLEGFVCEPDTRNVEYITPPLRDPVDLLHALLEPRRRLRRLLSDLGGYTIVPGSALAPPGAPDRFFRSDPENPYHAVIEQTYGTRVVTTSIHYNFGLDDAEDIIRATALLRLDAPVILALSAASPFFGGEVTGWHSTRWHVFPQTPPQVPFWRTHAEYGQWMQDSIAGGHMWNVRHLWIAARPNGPDRPQQLNRVELRISDFVSNPLAVAGTAMLVENRIRRLLAGELPDPLNVSDAVSLCQANEQEAARSSLQASLVNWETGRSEPAADIARSWLGHLYDGGFHLHDERQAARAVETILEDGNEAMRWLRETARGRSIMDVLQESIGACAAQEDELWRQYSRALTPPGVPGLETGVNPKG
ncbi:MAG: glutamate--cysteine ligase [Candidatus Xenobia bacterium]